jgi:hypothetical protein
MLASWRRGLATRASACLVSLMGFGACAATAPSVGRDQGDLQGKNGVVVGRFSVPPTSDQGATSRKMEIMNLATQEPMLLPFREGDSDDDSRSAPFLVELPAGQYQIMNWSLNFMSEELRQNNAFVTFEVAAGRITCIGALYPIREAATLRNMMPNGAAMNLKVFVFPRDECESLGRFVRTAAPNLNAPIDTKLARNYHCPNCRAVINAK